MVQINENHPSLEELQINTTRVYIPHVTSIKNRNITSKEKTYYNVGLSRGRAVGYDRWHEDLQNRTNYIVSGFANTFSFTSNRSVVRNVQPNKRAQFVPRQRSDITIVNST